MSRATKKKSDMSRGDAFSACAPPPVPIITPLFRSTAEYRSGGVIAQMGERLNGIQEVGSSILPGSTNRLD
jgi:hypothetical protein